LNYEIFSNSSPASSLLDIGCGTAFKLFPLTNHFSAITGIDISEDMVCSANDSIKKSGIKNIKILHGNSDHLPFEDNSFDAITCMLSRWDAKEIARVLKPSGNVIIEHIGCEDKIDFKILFGKDENGWRGQFIDFNSDEYIQSFYDLLAPLFESVTITKGFWKTFYTEQGILELLKFTPTIRNFNETTDRNYFKMACELFKCEEGIGLTQNRILIHAKNPRNF
jgi:ubiquinone/menaquinone biosynthesis C-methylase UbiE